MDQSATAFGRPVSQGLARQVLGDSALTALPSAEEPAQFPANELSNAYALLLYAAQEVEHIEKDPSRLVEIQQCRSFADRAYSEILEQNGMQGSPAASGPPPAPMPPPQPAPQAEPAPQGAGPGAPGVPSTLATA